MTCAILFSAHWKINEKVRNMIKIIDYNGKYDEEIKAIDEITFFTLKYHGDVIRDSICLAIDGRKLLGIGLLKAGATFLKVDELELPYYFIHAEYIADDSADVEKQVEASELLIGELKKRFLDIQKSKPGKRLILRLWCNAAKDAYLEFLIYHGFRPMRISPIMVRSLTAEDAIPADEGKYKVTEMNPYDDGFMKEYLITNGEAFEVADSAAELRFTMGGEDSHVFAVMEGSRVIAAVTTWKITDKRAATENIFCAADHRRKGVTSYLLSRVFAYLYEKGYEEASLTVFGDNQPAQQLYLKLGYELQGVMLECHYEDGYRNIGY